MDWDDLFDRRGVRWFHTGGIFTCLSGTTREVVGEALEAARRAGVVVSYDLNFRSKLWDSATAIAATRPLVPYIDCLIGNEVDFQKVLGYPVEGVGENLTSLPIESYQAMVRRVVSDFPNLSLVGTTLREVHSASRTAGRRSSMIGPRTRSGFIWAYLTGLGDPQQAVSIGTAHGALLQTTRGDTSQVTLAELRSVVAGGGARIQR